MNPIDKYNKRAKEINSLLCVGLDSDYEKIPDHFKLKELAQFEFNKWIIEETHEYAAAFKLNTGFYEARGDLGMREMKETVEYIKVYYPDIFIIIDAKRGDIGNTNSGYVTLVFDWLGADAITLHPYLGQEALSPFLERKDKASIILCRTSNTGAGEIQDIDIDGKKLWEVVAEKVSEEWNKNNNCVLVVGATYPEQLKKVRAIVGDMTILVPGIGMQGGDLESTLKNGLNSEGLGLIVSSSRGIIFTDNPKEEAKKLCFQIRQYSHK